MDGFQSTLRRKVRFTGTGLHSGRPVTLEILPAAANTGIVFMRADLAHSEPIPATVAQISSSELCTTIGRGGNTVATIEHLMAAFFGLGVDNAIVRVDAPEIPILDGSAAPFVDKMLAAGIAKVEGGRRKLLVVKEAFELREGNRSIRVEPADRLHFSCHIDYASAAIGQQTLEFVFSRTGFLRLCESRTFCHIAEVNAMRSAGLALGGSLENAVVVDDTSVINPEGLRYEDEFVRHKLLDCIGDLAMLGAPLVAKVTTQRSGHALHAKFMRELVSQKKDLLSVVEIAGFRETNQRTAVEDLTQRARVASAALR